MIKFNEFLIIEDFAFTIMKITEWWIVNARNQIADIGTQNYDQAVCFVQCHAAFTG